MMKKFRKENKLGWESTLTTIIILWRIVQSNKSLNRNHIMTCCRHISKSSVYDTWRGKQVRKWMIWRDKAYHHYFVSDSSTLIRKSCSKLMPIYLHLTVILLVHKFVNWWISNNTLLPSTISNRMTMGFLGRRLCCKWKKVQ